MGGPFNWPLYRLQYRHVQPVEWTMDGIENGLESLPVVTFLDLNVLGILLAEGRMSIEGKIEKDDFDDLPYPAFFNEKDSRWALSDVIEFIEDRAVRRAHEGMKREVQCEIDALEKSFKELHDLHFSQSKQE